MAVLNNCQATLLTALLGFELGDKLGTYNLDFRSYCVEVVNSQIQSFASTSTPLSSDDWFVRIHFYPTEVEVTYHYIPVEEVRALVLFCMKHNNSTDMRKAALRDKTHWTSTKSSYDSITGYMGAGTDYTAQEFTDKIVQWTAKEVHDRITEYVSICDKVDKTTAKLLENLEIMAG